MKKYITANNYKKYLTIDLFFIVLCLFLLVTYFSSAFYNDSISLPLMSSKVGEFYNKNSDLSVTVYQEIIDQYKNPSGNYQVVKDIPIENYTFSRYECLNNSIISYDDTLKSVIMDATMKDECKVYFNYVVIVES